VPIIKAEIHREDVFVHCVNHGSALWSVPDSADKRWSMKADRFTDSRTGALASTKRRHYRGPRSCQDQIVLHIHKHTHTSNICHAVTPNSLKPSLSACICLFHSVTQHHTLVCYSSFLKFVLLVSFLWFVTVCIEPTKNATLFTVSDYEALGCI